MRPNTRAVRATGGAMIVDWHVHAGEADFFDRYPHYADTFRQFWEPFVRLYGVDIFMMMNQPLEDKLQMLGAAGIDLAVFIGLDLLPDWDFRIPIDYLATLQDRHPDRIVAFPAINPKKGVEAALKDMDELAARGLKGFKCFPCFWGDPSDRRFYPLWERAVEHRLIAMFHMGSQIAPGARLKWCLPHLLDDVAMDFPELTLGSKYHTIRPSYQSAVQARAEPWASKVSATAEPRVPAPGPPNDSDRVDGTRQRLGVYTGQLAAGPALGLRSSPSTASQFLAGEPSPTY